MEASNNTDQNIILCKYNSITDNTSERTAINNSESSISSIENKNDKQRSFLSLTLENKGSVARDHLANERTFLAWLRTSLALVTLGIAITQLSKLGVQPPLEINDQLWIGIAYIVGSIGFIMFGLFRYFYIQFSLQQGKFPIPRIGMYLAVAFLSVLSITLIYTFLIDLP